MWRQFIKFLFFQNCEVFMKKKFLLGFILSFLILVGEISAQCPTGFTPIQINMDVNGCPYIVDLCVMCSPLGQFPGSVTVTGFMQVNMTPPCVQSLNIKEVLQYIESHVTNPDFYYTWLCPSQYSAPPCPDQSEPIELLHYNCWEVELIEYLGAQLLYYRVCDDDAYCYEKISWCYDANNNKYNRTVLEGPTQFGTGSCTLEAWEIEVPEQVGQISECFIIHNSCQ